MKSNIGFNGLPQVPDFAGSLNYIYGLSDFWALIFQDKDLLDRTLEAQSYQLADTYSKFLQLCSTVSIHQINTTFHRQLYLSLVNIPLDPTTGEENYAPAMAGSFSYTYNLPVTILKSQFVMDRPMLPNYTYTTQVDYNILEDGTVIEFNLPLSQLGFPVKKILVNGVSYNQYAFWVTDAHIDEQALWNYFGQFVKISPDTSTDLYKAFIQGLYFLYSNGPTFNLLQLGVNLSIGIPYARQTEEILLTFQDSESGNWQVVTANNSYTIPYGILPGYNVGDTIMQGAELSQVCTIEDYKSQDNWWLNIHMPQVLFPSYTNSATITSPAVADFPLSGSDSVSISTTGTWTGALEVRVSPDWGLTWGYFPSQTSNFTGPYGTAGFTNIQVLFAPTPTPTGSVTVTSIGSTVAVEGTAVDLYMRAFLKYNTFLVNIQLTDPFPPSSTQALFDLVTNAKPTYTTPVLVWAVPASTDVMIPDDSVFSSGAGAGFLDTMISPDYLIRLDTSYGQRNGNKWIKGNGDLTHYPGITVNVDHKVGTSPTSATPVTIHDVDLIPLYNLEGSEVVTVLATLGYTVPLGSLLEKFQVTGVNAVTHYSNVIKRQSTESTGVGWNTNSLDTYAGEVERYFLPGVGSLTTSETLVFMRICDTGTPLYSLFLYRAAGNTLFTPVYFDPNQSDPLVIYTEVGMVLTPYYTS